MGVTLWLTDEQERAVRQAYADGLTRTEAAIAAGITRQLLDTRLRDQLRDLRRGQGRRGKRERFARRGDPTLDELLDAIAAVRARWSPTDELDHRRESWAVLEGRWDGVHDLADRVAKLQRRGGAA